MIAIIGILIALLLPAVQAARGQDKAAMWERRIIAARVRIAQPLVTVFERDSKVRKGENGDTQLSSAASWTR